MRKRHTSISTTLITFLLSLSIANASGTIRPAPRMKSRVVKSPSKSRSMPQKATQNVGRLGKVISKPSHDAKVDRVKKANKPDSRSKIKFVKKKSKTQRRTQESVGAGGASSLLSATLGLGAGMYGVMSLTSMFAGLWNGSYYSHELTQSLIFVGGAAVLLLSSFISASPINHDRNTF